MLWPRRAHQELLLDLGERKSWRQSDLTAACLRASEWLETELWLLPQTPDSGCEGPADELAPLRELGAELLQGDPEPGVARWVCGLAPIVGTGPKALAGSLTGGLKPRRRDHRWLGTLARLLGASRHHPEAWCYHLRSPRSLGQALGSMALRGASGVGDALVLLSLLSLWQRRRSTTTVRANRGVASSRRESPKPVAAMQGALLALGQLRPLMRLAGLLDADRARLLVLLAFEAALTEAHLGPHRPRWGRGPLTDTGEAWLRSVQDLIDDADMLTLQDKAVLRFRLGVMRAWRDRVPLPQPEAEAADLPYVKASLVLERAGSVDLEPASFSGASPGLAMLLPLLRSRGVEVRR